MADDIIFDDSPIAKYIAQVNATSKRPRRNVGYKLERIEHTVPETERNRKATPDIKSVPTPNYRSNSANTLWEKIRRYMFDEFIGVKQGTIELLGQVVTDSCRSSNSAFTGTTVPPRLSNTAPAMSMVNLIRYLLYIGCFIVILPLLALFFGRLFGLTLAVVILPPTIYTLALFFKEYRYLLNVVRLVENCGSLASEAQDFVTQLRGALQLIQEVELVFRGYRITPLLSPIARLEQNAQNRRCHLLRQASHGAIFSVLRALHNFQKDASLNNAYQMMTSFDPFSDTGDASIAALKSASQHLQIYFAQYWQTLLVDLLNFRSESNEVWKMIDQPDGKTLSRVSADSSSLLQLVRLHATSLKKASSYQEAWVAPSSSSHKSPNATKNSSGISSLLDHMNQLQACLQTEVARIALCKDQLQGWDSGREATLNEVLQTFSKFESDLAIQLPPATTAVSNALNRLTRELQSPPERPSAEITPTKTHGEFETDISSNAASSSHPTPSLAEELASMKSKSAGPIKEQVYEAETGGDEDQEIIPSSLSREERIALARQAREEARKQEAEIFAKLNFVLELKDVLQARVAPTLATLPEIQVDLPPN